eukprot:GHUV01000424.1.p1 GENE.GHUV01000424.1~~GHUV01000424.1.p1  ORF type:complete len:143 (+),score=22.98 GHUV01000424.1:257-685(+)
MQSLAQKTSGHTGCGHRLAADVVGSTKSVVARNTSAIQRRAQRGDVRAEGAGSLVLSTLAAGVAAYYLSKHMDSVEQDQLQTTSRRPCPTCSGSGYEACHCTRWSDGDVGCSSCGRSGVMKCRSCGGGGTAVPIKVTIRKEL